VTGVAQNKARMIQAVSEDIIRYVIELMWAGCKISTLGENENGRGSKV
jgi:hypothetical protein